MTVAAQLYQLQEVDLAIESNEQAVSRIASQLGESEEVVRAQAKLTSEHQCLEELRHQQHSAEWEIDDLVAKLAIAENKLYSGEIRNPKELSNFQQEVAGLKAQRSQLEDKTLAIMEQVEAAAASAASKDSELKTLEAEWRSQQQQLSDDMEQHKTTLSELNQKRQQLVARIEPGAVEVYNELKKQKGTAVAKVEQGICRGCRISLPVTELQRVRSEGLVRCSSCGRILFLA
ncbi:MAG: zinc ribbon domain-containing protein [Dehalococcoidales bacterium]